MARKQLAAVLVLVVAAVVIAVAVAAASRGDGKPPTPARPTLGGGSGADNANVMRRLQRDRQTRSSR